MNKFNLPDDDDEVQLVHNDKGDEELATWDPESGETERTFNEMDFFGLRDKYTASESFVGTGAIAFAPSVIPINKARMVPKRRKPPRENTMADRRRRLAEESGSWFKEGPVRGDHQMDSPGGEGVAKKTATRETMNSKQDTKFKQAGDEWPRKHKGNLAMGTPEDHGQGGDYHSEAGDPDDGYLDATGHDWPDDPHNSGQGVAEPFDRTLDGTEMPKGHGPKGFGAGGPASDGANSTNEWSMRQITAMMEEDSFSPKRLQQLFDVYARETDYVCLENFAELIAAHGARNVLDEATLIRLMAANREFIFHEGTDASGYYWVPRLPISEGELPAALEKYKKKKGSDGDGDGEKNERSTKPWENEEDEGEGDKPWESANRRGRVVAEGKLPPALEKKKIPKGSDADGDGKKNEKAKKSNPFAKGRKDKKGGKKKPAFLKSESRDPDSRCRQWLETAQEIRNLLAERHVTPTAAARALQTSFNVQLSRHHLRGCSRPVLESIKRVVYHYGLSIDREIQQAKRLWEARYGMGGPPGISDRVDQMDYEDPDQMDSPPTNQFDELPEVDMGGEYGDDMDQFPAPVGDPGMEDGAGDPSMDGMEDEFDEFDPGFDPSPSGYDGIGRGGGSYEGNAVDNAMDHYRQHGPSRKPAAGGWQENRRRTRRPINEDASWFQDGGTKTADGHRMDQAGSPVGGDLGGGFSSDYPEEDAEMEEIAGENLLGHDQDNDGDGQVEFTHGGEGTMRDGNGPKGTAPEPKAGIKENLKRITGHVRKRLQECSVRVPAGKYALRFYAVVAGDRKNVHRALAHNNLTEAVADAEELLLMYGRQRVMLEAAYFKGSKEVHRERIGLPTIRPRGPLVTEGRALFRFPKHAEQFANVLMGEGATCRVVPNNWGTAVEAKVPARLAKRAFAHIIR